MAYRSSFEPILEAVGLYECPLHTGPMAEVSSLVWHSVISRGQNGLFWTPEQAAGWLKKNANTPRLGRWCCHVMRVTCAKFQGQSLILADFTLWLAAFMGDRSHS